AVAPSVRLHAPVRLLLPFARRDLGQRRELVVSEVLPAPERPRVGLREVHVEDVPAVDLSPDRDAVHRDCDFLSLVRPFEGLLPGPDRLDAPKRPTVPSHDRFPRTDSTGQHADAKDRGLRGPEHMFAKEEELRGIRDLLAARLGALSLPFLPPRLLIVDETVYHVVLEQR